jgi:hypothetical protein
MHACVEKRGPTEGKEKRERVNEGQSKKAKQKGKGS